MDATLILQLTKEILGFKTNVRDTYIKAIVDGVIKELEDEQGVVLDATNPSHLIFCADLSAWRYESKNSKEGMPRHLQFRLHNLVIHNGRSSII
jgi:hypothetical protein